jgi:hypothetical protein
MLSKRKKMAPMTVPSGSMVAKISGKTTKTRVGPPAGSLAKRKNGGKDHQPGENGNTRVKQGDIEGTADEIFLLWYIAAISEHQAHTETDGKEGLTEGH